MPRSRGAVWKGLRSTSGTGAIRMSHLKKPTHQGQGKQEVGRNAELPRACPGLGVRSWKGFWKTPGTGAIGISHLQGKEVQGINKS